MLSLIVAVAKNNVIGKNNSLIWHLPEDLKRFKKITNGKTIIMGKNTFESLGRILPNRKHIVLCNDGTLEVNNENVEILDDISLLDKYINDDNENFIIGGATIYRLMINKVNKMYITKINKEFEGDVYFPKFNEDEWNIIEREKGLKDEKNPFDYEYITYVRRNKNEL